MDQPVNNTLSVKRRRWLLVIATALGPINFALFYLILTSFFDHPFYERLGYVGSAALFLSIGAWLLLIPSAFSALTTWFFLKKLLHTVENRLGHVVWGVSFGLLATYFTTFYLGVGCTIDNMIRGTSSAIQAEFSLLISFTLFVGGMLAVLFLPVILPSGALFGLLAKRLKE